MELKSSTQSYQTHQKHCAKDSSKEVSGERLLLKETAFSTGGSDGLLMQKVIFVSRKKEPSASVTGYSPGKC